MKTSRNIFLILVVSGLASCNTSQRIVTTVNNHGSVQKEIYALADSAFMGGNKTSSPFLFLLDSDWKMTIFDSLTYNFFGKNQRLNTRIVKTFPSISGFQQVSCQNHMRPLIVPEESLSKSFRWFYTYYSYECKYQQIPDKGPLPISNYITPDELKLWLQGSMGAYQGMNGRELNDILDDIESKFEKWYIQSSYDICIDILSPHITDELYSSQLANARDSLFTIQSKEDPYVEYEPEKLCKLLDQHFNTTYYSDLYRSEGKELDRLYEENTKVLSLFEYIFSYELIMPGEIIDANTSLKSDNRLIWKVDAYRFFADDYILKAESRKVNMWAFVATGLLLLFALYCFIRWRKEK